MSFCSMGSNLLIVPGTHFEMSAKKTPIEAALKAQYAGSLKSLTVEMRAFMTKESCPSAVIDNDHLKTVSAADPPETTRDLVTKCAWRDFLPWCGANRTHSMRRKVELLGQWSS